MQLKEKTISGLKYSFLSTCVTAATQFLRIAILTRFLDKSDFGLVAIVLLVLGFTSLFSDLGFSVALMHKQEVSKGEFSSIFWINFGINIIIFFIIWAITPIVSIFYNEQILNKLIPLMGLELILNSFGKFYSTQMQKEMKFKFISIRDIIGAGISLIVAIVAAYYGFGVYSIIYSSLSNVIIVNLLNFINGYKILPIIFHISMKETKDFLQIGLFQTGAQILDYFANKIDVILIGKFFGTSNLGIYNLAKELILKPISLINSIINRVALPIFSKVQTNPMLLKEIYCKVIKSITFVSFPILAMFYISSSQLVIIAYGIHFKEVTPLFELLIIWGLISAINNPSSNLAIATGRTNLSFYWTSLRFAIGPLAIIIASLISIKAVACMQSVIALLFYYLFWRYIINKIVTISFSEYFELIFSSLATSILAIIFSRIIIHFVDIDKAIYGIIFNCSVFSTFYILLSLFTNKESFKIVKILKL